MSRYDFFKAELLKTRYFEDNIVVHFTASFAAVRVPIFYDLPGFERRHLLITRGEFLCGYYRVQ